MTLFEMVRAYRRPWINREQVYFAIVYTPRSGSNYLAERLDSAEGVTCHTEIFSPKSTYLSRQTEVPYIDREARDEDLWRFLQRLIAYASKAKAFGFKVGMYDLRSMLIYVLCSRRVKKLVIHRRNLLASFISLKEAERSGSWIKWRDDHAQTRSAGKLTLSLSEFWTYAAKIQIFYTIVLLIEKLTLQNFKWMPYENITQSFDKDEICEFLGVEINDDLSVKTTKQNRKPIREKIENIGHFEHSLRFVNAGWMLNENT